MKKLFLFLVISVLAFIFTACGDETSQASGTTVQRTQPDGTVVSRTIGRQPQTFHRPVIKKKRLLPPLNTQTWPIVATGQDKCYDNMKEVDCHDGEAFEYSGQDGRKRYGTRSLVRDSGNEIITDNVTSLRWTKKVYTDLSWYEAKNYCDNLRLDGRTWRLPTTAELRTLINYGKTEPAVDAVLYNDATGNATSSEALELKEKLRNWFWAAKHVHFNSEGSSNDEYAASWIVNFSDGFVEYTSRYNKYNVRCVSKF